MRLTLLALIAAVAALLVALAPAFAPQQAWASNQDLINARYYISTYTADQLPESYAGINQHVIRYSSGIFVEDAVNKTVLKDHGKMRYSQSGFGSDVLVHKPSTDQVREVCNKAGISFDSAKDAIVWFVVKDEDDGWHVDGAVDKDALAPEPPAPTPPSDEGDQGDDSEDPDDDPQPSNPSEDKPAKPDPVKPKPKPKPKPTPQPSKPEVKTNPQSHNVVPAAAGTVEDDDQDDDGDEPEVAELGDDPEDPTDEEPAAPSGGFAHEGFLANDEDSSQNERSEESITVAQGLRNAGYAVGGCAASGTVALLGFSMLRLNSLNAAHRRWGRGKK